MAYDDSNYDDIDALYEKSMTLLSANNMTNNIQRGMTSHFANMWTSHSEEPIEGMVIRMGFTIGIPSISQWRGFTGSQELCKRGGARGPGDFHPLVLSRANSRWGLGYEVLQKLKQNLKLEYKF